MPLLGPVRRVESLRHFAGAGCLGAGLFSDAQVPISAGGPLGSQLVMEGGDYLLGAGQGGDRVSGLFAQGRCPLQLLAELRPIGCQVLAWCQVLPPGALRGTCARGLLAAGEIPVGSEQATRMPDGFPQALLQGLDAVRM